MWSNQLSRLIFAIEKLIAYLYTPCSVPDKGMKTLLLWSLIKRRVDRFGGMKWIAITIIVSLATVLVKIFITIWPPRFDIIYERYPFWLKLCHKSSENLNIVVGANPEALSGQEIPVITDDVTPENLTKAAHYLTVYMKTVECMLSTGFHWRVQLPVKHLLRVVCNITDVTPDSVVSITSHQPMSTDVFNKNYS